jgi:hypothetical protein
VQCSCSPTGPARNDRWANQRAQVAGQVDRYIARGGDAALKRAGKSPSELTFEQKYFESLGGDELIEELKRKNLNPCDGAKLDYKIGELEDYALYVELGGDDAYVRLGGAQNKELTLNNRVKAMQSKLKLS